MYSESDLKPEHGLEVESEVHGVRDGYSDAKKNTGTIERQKKLLGNAQPEVQKGERVPRTSGPSATQKIRETTQNVKSAESAMSSKISWTERSVYS